MQLWPKALMENVSHQWVPLDDTFPMLQQGSRWPAVDFFSLFIMSLQPGFLVLKCKFCLPCKGYFSGSYRCFLQRSSAEISVMSRLQFWPYRMSLPYREVFILVAASWRWLLLWISSSLLFQRNLWTLCQMPTQPWYQSRQVSCRQIDASLVFAVPKWRYLLNSEIH